jgi:flagellar biosynthetic protein FlhB
MAEDRDTDSKTEDATEKKIHDAVERGDVPVSREVPILASLTAILIALVFIVPSHTEAFVGALMRFLDDASGWRLERSNDVLALAGIVGIAAVQFIIPVVLLLMIAGLIASAAQNPPRFVPDRIMPELSRLSPRAGFLRIFGLRGWTEFLKSLLKVFAVGILVTLILSGQRLLLATSMFDDVSDLPQRALKLCLDVIGAVLVATLVVAAADLAWARIHWRRDQRMSRHELKEELRQTEGDRLMKARLRSLRLDRSRKRMLAAVPRATMVIANPTHYAVAMRYVRSEGGAPIVLAKGVDLIALKIREIAEQHAVPIVEDRPLARALYAAASLDAAIPPEFYRAVAEIVHLIHEKRSSWPIVRNG